MIEMFRGGPDYLIAPIPHARARCTTARFPGPARGDGTGSRRHTGALLQPQQGLLAARAGSPSIGPFFNRGLMLLDFDEHMFHRRIMQEAFVRTRLVGYTEQVDQVVSKVIANDWVANDPRFLLYPAMKETDPRHRLDGVHGPRARHRPRTRDQGEQGIHHDHRAGNAIIRTSVPPFTWWRGLQARKLPRELLRGAGHGTSRRGRARTC